MYDEYGEPSETLVTHWNEHNDHVDGANYDEPEPNDTAAPVGLDALYALARESRAQQQADELDYLAQKRAEQLALAESAAARDWADGFHNYGTEPPPLAWQGYADQQAPDGERLYAVAHLGRGVFLAHQRAQQADPWKPPQRTEFTLIAPCVCAPNRYRQERVTGLWTLADALDKAIGPHPACAHTCAGSFSGRVRP